MYKPVIGLEIHVELNTKTKMFCSCSAEYWGKEPNTHTCPVCLGLPGALPYANSEALKNCIKIGLALNCEVSEKSRFERKNYFYPDLPKGYQISQYRWPLCKGGELVLSSGKRIKVNRVHMEEDTAKLVHTPDGTGVDFNRSGVPLVEMVTEPDFDNIEDVVEFAKSFQQIVKDLGVSNADMEKGDLRLEANVSVRPEGQEELPNYRIELKNINSFRFMAHALEHEIKRQTEALEKGETLTQETRGWNEDKRESYLQRSKEEAHDYRYFPEPDLPPLAFTADDVEKIKSSMSELGSAKVSRLVNEYEISESAAKTLVTQNLVGYFEDAAKIGEVDAKVIANVIVNKRIDFENMTVEDFVAQIKSQTQKQGLANEELEKVILQVVEENQKVVEDYKNGKENALQALVGMIMGKTKGQADPKQALQMLKEKLS